MNRDSVATIRYGMGECLAAGFHDNHQAELILECNDGGERVGERGEDVGGVK